MINVIVTGIGGGGHGEQILKALRLSDIDLNIIGTDIMENSSGKKYINEFYKVPPVTNPEYFDKILEILHKHDIKFLFHGSEPEMKFFSENRDKLEKEKIMHCLNSHEIIKLCMNKYETYNKLVSLKIKVPRYLKINSIDDIKRINFFPIVLKPNTASGGSAHVQLAIDFDEALLLANYLLKRKIDLIAQEYIGSYDNEYTIGVSSDSDAKILGSIVIKRELGTSLSTRLKMKDNEKIYMISTGISQGKVTHIPALQQQAERIAKLLESKGPLNIQCRTVNGDLMLMEINPRLSGTTSIRAMAGYNEPALMINYYLFNKEWVCNYKDINVFRTLEEVIVNSGD